MNMAFGQTVVVASPSWGNALGKRFVFRRLANGHIQIGRGFAVNMTFGQTFTIGASFWGGAPGYGDGRPSANGLRVAVPETCRMS
jgi:hypothetical protein